MTTESLSGTYSADYPLSTGYDVVSFTASRGGGGFGLNSSAFTGGSDGGDVLITAPAGGRAPRSRHRMPSSRDGGFWRAPERRRSFTSHDGAARPRGDLADPQERDRLATQTAHEGQIQ